MTTTNVSVSRLRAAVIGYTAVEGLRVHTSFPHGLRIEVMQRVPLARLDYGGTIVAVSRDDRVLAGIVPPRSLPLVRTTRAPLEGRVVDPLSREELALLASAPVALRVRVYSVTSGSEGLTVRLRGGPLVYFGNTALPHAKWDSAAAVLATASARGASSIDVSLPSRPAAQVANPQTSATAAGSTLSATLDPAAQTTGSSSTSG
jgi:cell division protein FtsQ